MRLCYILSSISSGKAGERHNRSKCVCVCAVSSLFPVYFSLPASPHLPFTTVAIYSTHVLACVMCPASEVLFLVRGQRLGRPQSLCRVFCSSVDCLFAGHQTRRTFPAVHQPHLRPVALGTPDELICIIYAYMLMCACTWCYHIDQSNLISTAPVCRKRMMAEICPECSVYAMSNSSVFSILRWNELASWAELQSNVSEFQTARVLTLEA